jgi:uncharacterized membrane protein YuzA (DUF378 family)
MNAIFYTALCVHIASGSAALLVGLPTLITAKGERTHRRLGRWFMLSMYGVLGSAAVMTLVALKPYFAALTVGAAISTFSGLRVLRRKRPDLDPGQRATPLDWGFTSAAAALLLVLLSTALRGEVGQNATVFYALIGGAAAYTLWDLWRFASPLGWPFFPKLWFYEHLVKMIASLSAVVAAFSGSVLHFLPIPEPWKQLWSTILFHNVMIGMIIWYALIQPRLRRAAAAG